ncbi:hypothetical protein CKM354_000505400 [Cercospora kikuchii]|uniref:FAD-binding PCMH-type domain-containing protein n=1 Tax=Cercospora kikuchii TaxID=84275 RepID=A0A9P3FGD9_9PEZI|nr:uncharacterized protein CKM354_000505400 [Cercospora kikuchii]GIZ41759.1 hypothetical protein CKM354_000505400 [Cercospora kikuchii]
MLATTLFAAVAFGVYANARVFARQPGQFESCVAQAVGNNAQLYAVPTGANYNTSLNVYNLDHIYTPSAIAFPTSAEQVAALVKCACSSGVAVQSLSGGHSYLNFGLGGQNGSLSIRLANINQTSYDEFASRLTFGTGNLLSGLTTALQSANRTAAYSGIGSIGTGGHFAIGGLGPLSRQHGLAADQVVEVEVVTKDGQIVKASEDENEDLFWAVRGAAWSFGIVTSITIDTVPVVSSTSYSYIIPGNASTLASVVSAWQEIVSNENLPREFGSTVYIWEGFVLITGSYFGSQEDLDRVGLDAFTQNAIPTSDVLNALDSLNVTAAASLLTILDDAGLLDAIISLPREDIYRIFQGILQILPTIETGNLTAIQQAATATNSTLLGAAFAFLPANTTQALFGNLTSSGVLDLLSNQTTLTELAPLLLNINFTTIVELVDQVEEAGFLQLLGSGSAKLSELFSVLFTSHLPTHFYSKSLKFTEDTLPSTQATGEVVEYILSNTTDRGTPLWFVIWDLGGGAINDPAQDDTAYWHRDALIWLQSYTVNLAGAVSATQKEFLTQVNEKYQSLVPGVDDSAYAGYVDDALTDPVKSYWGGNVEKLKQIKAKYDSSNIFRNGQSITA